MFGKLAIQAGHTHTHVAGGGGGGGEGERNTCPQKYDITNKNKSNSLRLYQMPPQTTLITSLGEQTTKPCLTSRPFSLFIFSSCREGQEGLRFGMQEQ